MSEKDIVCFCFEISRQEIVEIIQKHKTTTVEELQKYCQASMGCGGCRPDVEKIIEEELAKMA